MKMIKIIPEKKVNEDRVLPGITMLEIEAGLVERAIQFVQTSCEAIRYRMDVDALNYIRSNVCGIGERERLYHFYMDLRNEVTFLQ